LLAGPRASPPTTDCRSAAETSAAPLPVAASRQRATAELTSAAKRRRVKRFVSPHMSAARCRESRNDSSSPRTLLVTREMYCLTTGQSSMRTTLFLGVNRPSTEMTVLPSASTFVVQRLAAVRNGPAEPSSVYASALPGENSTNSSRTCERPIKGLAKVQIRDVPTSTCGVSRSQWSKVCVQRCSVPKSPRISQTCWMGMFVLLLTENVNSVSFRSIC